MLSMARSNTYYIVNFVLSGRVAVCIEVAKSYVNIVSAYGVDIFLQEYGP